MNIVVFEQRSESWFAARCGSLGASALHEAVARTKTGYSASRSNRMAVLVIEQLTGQTQDTYQNAAMLAGIEREPMARAMYEFMTNESVVEIGMARHPTIAGTHASPDGLIGSDGVLEIKAPQPAQHLSTLMGEPIQNKYVLQVQWEMACTGRKWCDFVSFNPDFPPAMQLFIKRIDRDDIFIAALEKEVAEFLSELRDTVHRLRQKYEPETAELPEAARLMMAG